MITLAFGVFVIVNQAVGQDQPCLTDELHQQMIESNPNYIQGMGTFNWNSFAESENSQTVYKVPVVVHVIHNGGTENISYAQIEDAIAVLNEDFRRLNSDTTDTKVVFRDVAKDARIEFYLAKRDPNGECTDGVVRVKTPLAFNAHNHVKYLSQWNHRDYMNIWVVGTIENTFGSNGTILGFAYYPNTFQNFWHDGILIRHDCMGRIGSATGGFGPNAQGRTLTHEVGHYLGLPHTFPPSGGLGCADSNDGFSDTPPISGPNSGCPSASHNTCTNDNLPDQTENYMDYSYGICQNMFSEQQTDRIRQSLGQFGIRSNLVNSGNQNTTGIFLTGDTCVPKADIRTDNGFICIGDSVQLIDMSWNAPVVSRAWSVPGSTLSSTTDSIVWAHFNAPGSYSPQITVQNTKGTDTYIWESAIIVREAQGNDGSNYFENFQTASDFHTDWVSDSSAANKGWEIGSTGFQSNQSIFIENYYNDSGDVATVYMPSLDLSTIGVPAELRFRYAYAKKTASSKDQLKVYVSNNCGQFWLPRKVIKTNALHTASNLSLWDYWTPTYDFHWEEAVLNLSPYMNSNSVHIKFEFISGDGNNIFIDNVNVSYSLSIEELLDEIILYPNPSEHGAKIDFGGYSGEAEIEILDEMGRKVFTEKIKIEELNGFYTLPSKEVLNSGICFVNLRLGDRQKVLQYILL